jgi:hypothetical protein
MSAKWQRVKAWDDAHLTGPLTPLRWLLRVLSSIWLGVTLLVLVSLYSVLASVPIGLIALAPTYAFYSVTILAFVAVIALLPATGARLLLRRAGRAARFAVPVLVFLALAPAAVALWHRLAWPALHHDPVNQTGVRFFGEFVDATKATTLRRLPGFEMTELEFYGWWPMRWMLLLFTLNMVVATIRRIEFTFKNLGVLTVHTGIVTMALGSVFYNRFKQEGDTILLAGGLGDPNSAASAPPGAPQGAFYDNTEVVLYIAQRADWTGQRRWEQRPLRGLPRYNDYALDAGAGAGESPDAQTLWAAAGLPDPLAGLPDRPLSLRVPGGAGHYVDQDIALRVVGYASYAEPREDWVRADPLTSPDVLAGEPVRPLRVIELFADLPPESGVRTPEAGRPAFRFQLFPTDPSHRVAVNRAIGIEYTQQLSDDRFALLATALPAGVEHALVVAVPRANAEPLRAVIPAVVGEKTELGATGFSVGVVELHEEPPFPIVTEGFQNATSSVAVVRIETPDGRSFDRWLYSRFPEIDQDIAGMKADGRPNRGPADRALLEVDYLDASRLQVLFDDRADGSTRAIVRQPAGPVRVVDRLGADQRLADLLPNDQGASLDLVVATRWAHARRFERPVPTPEDERDRQMIGTHDRAMVAVEVSLPGADGPDAPPRWRSVVWMPFSRYLGVTGDESRTVHLPDGREVSMAFGRRQHPFPDFQVRLLDFEMVAYDHRGAPRDFQSIVRVEPRLDPENPTPRFESFDHVVKLNNPLRAPYHWDPDASWVKNTVMRLSAGLNPRQFKLSQAGWDQQGWQRTQQLADEGVMPRPRASFTILGVGNNPGIHVIALGGILMSVGVPWAFYVKPWLVRREKRRLAAAVARGEITPRGPRTRTTDNSRDEQNAPVAEEVPT